MNDNILIAQSGGPTSAINATLTGIIRAGMEHKKIVYGGINGIQGISEGRIIRLDDQIRSEEDFDLLRKTPAMALGSCRFRLPAFESAPELYATILKYFKALQIGYFFYIGGNDSMDTALKLHRYFTHIGEDIKVIGVPKTIDNDLECTDHTPGFGSAVKYLVATILEVAKDACVYPKPAITIVEVMGRDAGWLTASSGLAHVTGGTAPHLIYLPEIPFEPDRYIKDLERALAKHRSVIVAVSEGIRMADGNYARGVGQSVAVDSFGHALLSGAGRLLENMANERFDSKVRAIELSTLQRSAAHFASRTDIEEAEMVGKEAAGLAFSGHSGVMAAIQRLSNYPYRSRVQPVDIAQAANKVKAFPLHWLDQENARLTQEGIDYFLPLIGGELPCITKDGIPLHFTFCFEPLAL